MDWENPWFGDGLSEQGAHCLDTMYSTILLKLPIGIEGMPEDIVTIYGPEGCDSSYRYLRKADVLVTDICEYQAISALYCSRGILSLCILLTFPFLITFFI